VCREEAAATQKVGHEIASDPLGKRTRQKKKYSQKKMKEKKRKTKDSGNERDADKYDKRR